MKAIIMEGFALEDLKINDIAKPTIKPHQVLLKVKAASINYLDLLVIKGIFNDKLPLPHIPLTDVVGVIEQIGNQVTNFSVGDSVIPIFMRGWDKGKVSLKSLDYIHRPSLGINGYAQEYLAINSDEIVNKPNNLSYEEACTLPIAATSAWNGIRYLDLNPGDSVLLYGTGGVTTFATMFAKLRGLKIFVAGLDSNQLKKMLEIGADKVFNVKENTEWKTEILRETNNEGVNGIYESVGGENLQNSFDLISFKGRITYVGLINGFSINNDISKFIWKQAQLIGMECGSKEDLEQIVKAIEVNNIKPVIDKVFEFHDFSNAFRHLEQGGHFGKIVIKF